MRYSGRVCQQRLLQLDTRDAKARADFAPKLFEVRPAYQLAVIIENVPAPKDRPAARNEVPEAEHPQHPHTFRGQINPCSNRWPSWIALDKLGGEALPVEGGGKAQPSNSTADNQGSLNVGVTRTSLNVR
jgi:hypothetical protein